MDEVRFDIDLEVTRRDAGVVRTWVVSLAGKVLAQHETLDAALAACVYQAEVELRHRRGALIALVTFPLPDGSRAEMHCTPTRDRLPVLVGGRAYGATGLPDTSATT